MCGILGIIGSTNTRPRPSDADVERMRDTLLRRGPDSGGIRRQDNWILAHRRLAVRDTSSAGDQPMSTPDGRYQLVYNGELYNENELREELLALDAVPGGFRSQCDTETVLWAFATWGPEAFEKLRGMFAIAVYDVRERRLHLARDPLGIKPLYYYATIEEFVFASEPRAILAHPDITPEPDLAMASAYLSTLRSTLGSRTLFRHLNSVEPGERVLFNADNGALYRTRFHSARPVREEWMDPDQASEEVREVIEDSVRRHLRSDVPISAMLSGGLDSTIICRIAQAELGDLHTWCAGAKSPSDDGDDLSYAREAAESIGTVHREVTIDRDSFSRDWPRMVDEVGLPLSTPNEVAIHAVCSDLRARGRVITLSGEGADELFGGYEANMQVIADDLSSGLKQSGGSYQLEKSAWIMPNLKSQVFTPEAFVETGGDAFLSNHFECLFKRCEVEAGELATELDVHLRFLRYNNLTGLLQRLDSASMLSAVESRTPFADVRVLDFADSLPMSVKFHPEPLTRGGGTALLSAVRGKLLLRQAWRDQIPATIVSRQKQSFPLPFRGWMESATSVLERSPFARDIFAAEVREELASNPEQFWQCAWPMLNLALWGEYWFD